MLTSHISMKYYETTCSEYIAASKRVDMHPELAHMVDARETKYEVRAQASGGELNTRSAGPQRGFRKSDASHHPIRRR